MAQRIEPADRHAYARRINAYKRSSARMRARYARLSRRLVELEDRWTHRNSALELFAERLTK